MAKEKKIETRDILYEQLAQGILARGEVEQVERFKEGLKTEVDGETHIIRVIKKKNEPEDLVGVYKVTEDGAFRFVEQKG